MTSKIVIKAKIRCYILQGKGSRGSGAGAKAGKWTVNVGGSGDNVMQKQTGHVISRLTQSSWIPAVTVAQIGFHYHFIVFIFLRRLRIFWLYFLVICDMFLFLLLYSLLFMKLRARVETWHQRRRDAQDIPYVFSKQCRLREPLVILLYS